MQGTRTWIKLGEGLELCRPPGQKRRVQEDCQRFSRPASSESDEDDENYLMQYWRPKAGLDVGDVHVPPAKRARLAKTSLLFENLRRDMYAKILAEHRRRSGEQHASLEVLKDDDVESARRGFATCKLSTGS
jgi:hypothetical protein